MDQPRWSLIVSGSHTPLSGSRGRAVRVLIVRGGRRGIGRIVVAGRVVLHLGDDVAVGDNSRPPDVGTSRRQDAARLSGASYAGRPGAPRSVGMTAWHMWSLPRDALRRVMVLRGRETPKSTAGRVWHCGVRG